ncbi:MAG: hypothetical protein CO108_13375 [Deltaproteobacteria bacterium CG_4_9_14_3_um_filter_63_12]|nr:MAG: hypothetical protein CO108_13375 [Deltaproteobacteria bacterium CG_4_9_14_3_um_filter_63_12]
MENKVGDTVPSEDTINATNEELTKARQKLKPFLVSLSVEERRRALRFRPGGEAIVALMAKLARQTGVSLPGVSVEGMEGDLALSKTLSSVEENAQVLLDAVSDTRLQALSEAWWAATALYTSLSRVADSDPELARALKPATEFFAVGRRTPKTETL